MSITETTEAGNTFEAEVYVDPYPGRKGSDIVSEDCGWCSGTGVYTGKSGYQFYTPATGGVNTGCFHCTGLGHYNRKVSSIRATARRRVNSTNQRRADAADMAETWAAEAAVRLAKDWDEALEEEARRAAAPKGFWGEVDDVVNLTATVRKATTYEGQNYMTGSPELKGLVIFTNAAGQPAIYYTTTTQAAKFEEDHTYTIKATVKKHGADSRTGDDQTVVTRVSIGRNLTSKK